MSQVTRVVGPLFEDGQLTLSATLTGLGAALLRAPLIRSELAAGTLVQLSDEALNDGRDYYLCVRSDVEMTEGARRLADWLQTTTLRATNAKSQAGSVSRRKS